MHISVHVTICSLVIDTANKLYIFIFQLALWFLLIRSDWCLLDWQVFLLITQGLDNAFGCMWFESTSTYYTLQNGGGRQQREKKEVAWYNRTLQGEEALRPYSSTLDHRCAFACVLCMWSITVCLRMNTWNITYNNFFPARSWASGGQGVCSSAGQGVPLQERFTGLTGDQTQETGRP